VSLFNAYGGFSSSAREMMLAIDPEFPVWTLQASGWLALLAFGFAAALTKWKRWGFWGLCAVSLASLGVNLYAGQSITASLYGIAAVAVLFGLFFIGGEKKAWPRLE
jgi:hypothetical protein